MQSQQKFTKVPNTPIKLDKSALVAAIKKGELETIQKHVESTDNVDALDKRYGLERSNLLDYAAGLLQKDIVEYLLKKGANPEKTNFAGFTAIHNLIFTIFQRRKHKEEIDEAKVIEILNILLAKIHDPVLLDRILFISNKFGTITSSNIIRERLEVCEKPGSKSRTIVSSTNIIKGKIGVSAGKEEVPLQDSSSSSNDRLSEALKTIGELAIENKQLKLTIAALEKELNKLRGQQNLQERNQNTSNNLFGTALIK